MVGAVSELVEKLEREWAKERDPGVERVLRDAYAEQFLAANPPEPGREELESATRAYVDEQIERLSDEVQLDVRRSIVEELSGEQGNLDNKPWKVRPLTEAMPYHHNRPQTPDYVTPEGVELWTIVRDVSERDFVIDAPPEFMERELKNEFGHDAEFNTVYDGGDAEYLVDSGGDSPALWQRVRQFGLGERECPFLTWDPEEREDAQGRKVSIADTQYGEHPGQWCRLCEARVGEKHGYLYLGEEAQGVVYVRLEDATEPLPSTVDTPEMEREVLEAFRASGLAEGDEPRRRSSSRGVPESIETFYEHGQWWVRVAAGEYERGGNYPERTYSVVDTHDGFDFEEV